MATDIAKILPMHKESILQAYFKICTLAYAIRYQFGYVWDETEGDPHKIFSIISDPECPLHRLAELTAELLVFCFAGTDPDHQLIEEPEDVGTPMHSQSARSPKKGAKEKKAHK